MRFIFQIHNVFHAPFINRWKQNPFKHLNSILHHLLVTYQLKCRKEERFKNFSAPMYQSSTIRQWYHQHKYKNISTRGYVYYLLSHSVSFVGSMVDTHSLTHTRTHTQSHIQFNIDHCHGTHSPVFLCVLLCVRVYVFLRVCVRACVHIIQLPLCYPIHRGLDDPKL